MKTIYLLPVFLLVLLLPGQAKSQPIYGCTDPLSTNYNANATVNDGSCTYSTASINPENTVALPAALDETSGLFIWDGSLYTMNDDTDTQLYKLDPQTGNIQQGFTIQGVVNQDWEEIAQDNAYIYIGDFGNNASGNRTNLHILRVNKSGLLNNTAVADNINFSYSNQTGFTATGANNTDFDCEAMVVSNDSIYLFTKQWVSKQTSIYALPKTPGTYVAQLKGTLDVNGLITGAAYLENERLVVLCGYSGLVSPFIYLLYDFQGHDFFSGNKRKISISQSFHQMEGIATVNGLDYYITNEHLQQGGVINVEQKLERFDLSQYLEGYFSGNASISGALERDGITISPNPTGEVLIVNGPEFLRGLGYFFIDMTGRHVLDGELEGERNNIDVSSLATGIYELVIAGYEEDVIKLAIQ